MKQLKIILLNVARGVVVLSIAVAPAIMLLERDRVGAYWPLATLLVLIAWILLAELVAGPLVRRMTDERRPARSPGSPSGPVDR